METKINKARLILFVGDITDQSTDAIVNAANTELQLGGGVAGAIRKKGGPAIQSECNQHRPVNVGDAVLTTGGDLNAKHVIHAVGPRMGEGDEDQKLKQATLNTLKTASRHDLKSLAFCAISTGIFGCPMERCAKVMLKNTIDYLKSSTSLEKVVFCLYDKKAYDIFARELHLLV